ncbi:MAG: gliding motility-associated C-terminal domain-containing protein [Flavobacteriales bacterium]|nr:gliding motility-associated C-terminal domain-containing protein [Flavobacteriales bacterium]
MLNRWSILLATALAATSVHATHIVGGELYYDHLGGSQYQLTLKLYRDCTGIAFDGTVVIGVFNASDFSLYTTTTLVFPGGSNVPITLDSPCLTLPPNICVETTSYTGVVSLPASPDGYILAYQRCCRTGIISNLQSPADLGLTVIARIPGQAIASNSSARFNELPPIALCLNAPLVFDHSATDPDGDQLVYSLTTPFNGGTNGNPQPNPPDPPPYSPVPWLAPYTETNPIDANPGISIDAVTGELTVTPTLQGNFTIGVMAQEYRDGVLLNETRRDFLFKVVACDATVNSVIQPQNEFCDDLTMSFSSVGNGATSYFWDFGEPITDADTANVAGPQWTFTEPGTYQVTLVANPGTTCADTAVSTFNIYLAPQPLIEPPPPACGNDPVTLSAGGLFGPSATFQWQLGFGSVPTTANTGQVTVQFPNTGTHEVALTVGENGCTGFTTAQVVNAPQPVAAYTVSPPSPQLVGTSITFTDASNASGGQIASWSWTIDDTEFNATTASATWNPTMPGTYHITLTVVDAQGCTDTIDFYYTVIGGPIIIPNVFSPNGDDHNETFHIQNVEQYNNDLWVYNRWGSKVYTSRNYKNQWDGDDVPDGTYYYVLRIDNGDEYAGHVTLLR